MGLISRNRKIIGDRPQSKLKMRGSRGIIMMSWILNFPNPKNQVGVKRGNVKKGKLLLQQLQLQNARTFAAVNSN